MREPGWSRPEVVEPFEGKGSGRSVSLAEVYFAVRWEAELCLVAPQ